MNLFPCGRGRLVVGVLALSFGLLGLGLAPRIPFANSLERFLPPERRKTARDLLMMVSLRRPDTEVTRVETARALFEKLSALEAIRAGLDPVVLARRSGLPLHALWSGMAVPGGQGFSVAGIPLVARGGRILNGLYRIQPGHREGRRLLKSLERLRARHLPEGWRLSAAGVPVINGWLAREARALQSRLIPLLVVLVFTTLLVLYRSVRILIAVGATVAAATGGTFLIMYALGYPNDILSVLPPMLVMVITVSGTVHILSELEAVSGSLSDRLQRALRQKGPPALYCHLSTAVGFGSLALSRMPSVRSMGIVSALGIGWMSLVLFTSFPLLVRTVKPRGTRLTIPALPFLLRRMSRPAAAACVLAGVGVLAAGAALYPGLAYESRALMYFPDDHPLRRDVRRVSRDFLSPRHDTLRLSWKHAPDERRLRRWVREVSGWEGVRRVLDTRRLPGGDLFWGARGGDRRVLVFYSLGAVNRLAPLRRRLRRSARDRLAGLDRIRVDGVLDQVTRVQGELRRTLQMSMLAAAGVIFVMLAVIVRDRWLFLAGLLANLLPLSGVILLVKLSRIPLDAGMILIFSVTLGLALDDTLHFLHVYRTGQNTADDTLRRVLSPLVITTVVLCLGIGAFAGASFRPVSHFGMFAAAGLVLALVADLLFLPSLLRLVERRAPG